MAASTEGLFAQRRTGPPRDPSPPPPAAAAPRTREGGTTTIQGQRASGSRTVTQTGDGYNVNQAGARPRAGPRRRVSKEVDVENREIDKTLDHHEPVGPIRDA